MGVYIDLKVSILSYLREFIDRNGYTDVDVFDFDAHATLQDLPDSDLIGVMDYSIENQKDQYSVTCVIAVCTKSDDANITRLSKFIDDLFSELKPGFSGEKIKITDPTGLKRGYLTVMDDVMAMPVGSSKTRPFQGIAIHFGAGYAALPF